MGWQKTGHLPEQNADRSTRTLASVLCYMEVEMRLKETCFFVCFVFNILHKIQCSVHHLVTKQVVCIPECMTFIWKAFSSESWTGRTVFWLIFIVDFSHMRQMKWGFLMYGFIQYSVIHNTIRLPRELVSAYVWAIIRPVYIRTRKSNCTIVHITFEKKIFSFT